MTMSDRAIEEAPHPGVFEPAHEPLQPASGRAVDISAADRRRESPAVLSSARALRLARTTAILITVVLAVFSFVISFAAIRDLAIKAGQPADLAWMYPPLLDLAIVQSTLCVIVLAGRRDKRGSLAFYWIELALTASASVGANVAHALLHATGVAAPLAAVIAGVPPVMLLLNTHGLSLLARTRALDPGVAAPAAQEPDRVDDAVGVAAATEVYVEQADIADDVIEAVTVQHSVPAAAGDLGDGRSSPNDYLDLARDIADIAGTEQPVNTIARALYGIRVQKLSQSQVTKTLGIHHVTLRTILERADQIERVVQRRGQLATAGAGSDPAA